MRVQISLFYFSLFTMNKNYFDNKKIKRKSYDQIWWEKITWIRERERKGQTQHVIWRENFWKMIKCRK